MKLIGFMRVYKRKGTLSEPVPSFIIYHLSLKQSVLLELDFLQFQPNLRLTRAGDTTLVRDPVRRKDVVLTPEELLRQLVLHYLLDVKHYPLNRIRVEIGLKVNGQPRRGDILVFDPALKPWLLVECKSPKVALTEATFGQAARYNMSLQVPFLAITNGLATFCCAMDYEQGGYAFLADFPSMKD